MSVNPPLATSDEPGQNGVVAKGSTQAPAAPVPTTIANPYLKEEDCAHQENVRPHP